MKALDININQDIRDAIVGELLGEGTFRTVYEYLPDANYVIKIQNERPYFGDEHTNIAEYRYWWIIKNTPAAKWLAPCHSISSSGLALIQERVKPITQAELPKRLPAFLQDIKYNNFGRIKNRIVCCDYANLNISIDTKKMLELS